MVTDTAMLPRTMLRGIAPSQKDESDRASLITLKVFVLALVLLQRFTIPASLTAGSKLSIMVPITLVVLGILAVRGYMVADLARTGLYLAAVALCLLTTLLAASTEGLQPSFNSLIVLVAIYVPLCFRLTSAMRSRFPEILQFFQKIMVFAAAACVFQYATQAVGITYDDILRGIPPDFVYTKDEYNLFYPMFYGSPIQKANGYLFLEPSFTSQFLALAIIVQVLLGGKRWRLVLFGAGLIATVSGTGILLLAVGLAVIAARRGSQWAIRAVVAAAAAAVVVLLTPAGPVLLERAGETSEPGSSGNIRFVTPYTNVASAVARDQGALWIGRGAGAVDRDAAFFNPSGVDVNYAAFPKLVGEYGLPAALVFSAFVLTVIFWRTPSPTLGVAAFLVYFVLSGSLVQPQTVYLCWLFTGLFAAAGAAGSNRGRRYYHVQPPGSVYRSLMPPPVPPPVQRIPAPAPIGAASDESSGHRTMRMDIGQTNGNGSSPGPHGPSW